MNMFSSALLLVQQNGDSNAMLVGAVVLLVVSFGAFMVEIFVPSGGLLGLISASCLVVGVVMLCLVNLTWGLVVAVIAVMALPFAIGFALKIWPDTPVGRWLSLAEPADKAGSQEVESVAVGAQGRAVTELRPVGMCMINGKREECLARRGMIEAGASIRVVSVEGMQIYVEVVEV